MSDALGSRPGGEAPYIDIEFEGGASSNTLDVTFTFKGHDGTVQTVIRNFLIWLSESSVGQGLNSNDPSGTTAAYSGYTAILDTHTAKKAFTVQSLATGLWKGTITDTAGSGYYFCAQHPTTGQIFVSELISDSDFTT